MDSRTESCSQAAQLNRYAPSASHYEEDRMIGRDGSFSSVNIADCPPCNLHGYARLVQDGLECTFLTLPTLTHAVVSTT